MRLPSLLDRRYWVLVINKSRALFFQRYRPADEFKLVRKLEHPVGRLRSQQIKSDKPGRTSRVHMPMRNGYSSPISAEEHLAMQFAQEVAGALDHARDENLYDWLVIVAGPKMLGIVRNHLEPATLKRVIKSVNQDMHYLDDREVQERLRNYLKEIDSSPEIQKTG